MERTCEVCKKVFLQKSHTIGKFCSANCYRKTLKGKKKPEGFGEKISRILTGRKFTEEWKQNLKKARWKNHSLDYGALHTWLKNNFGKANHCELCKVGTKFNWSNKTGIYNRDMKNWWQLCLSCHRKYDARPEHDKKRSATMKKRVLERTRNSKGRLMPKLTK